MALPRSAAPGNGKEAKQSIKKDGIIVATAIRQNETKQNTGILCILSASLLLTGLFYAWEACLCAVALAIYLLKVLKKQGKLYLPGDPLSVSVYIVVLFYGLSAFWAVDRGMALLGFAKQLCVPLFLIAAAQQKKEERELVFSAIPYAGAVMTAASFLLGQIPALRQHFFVNSRLTGFFQYANTFALLLLLGVIVIGFKPSLSRRDLLVMAVLIAGIGLSGSRTSFLLLLGVCGLIVIKKGDRKLKLAILGMLLALLFGGFLYAVLTGTTRSIGRYLSISFSSSTLVGRLLYWRDALPVIAGHPFGLGYLGYHYTQGSFQSGVYSVRFIHNEFLQLLLDIGWLPTLTFAAAMLKKLLQKGRTARNITIAAAILLHSMMDFDLQFQAIVMLLLLALQEENSIPQRTLQKPGTIASLCIAALLCAYFAVPAGFAYLNRSDKAVKIYPFYTDANVSLLQKAKTAAEMEMYADAILRVNRSCAIAYDAKAMVAYARADFRDLVYYKEKALSLRRYELSGYTEYIDMLVEGIRLSGEHEEIEELCRDRLAAVPDILSRVQSETSSLAWKIYQTPDLELPEEYRQKVADYGANADSNIGGLE